MTDDVYTYPGTDTLRNKLGITDPDRLDAFERRIVAEGVDHSYAQNSPRNRRPSAYVKPKPSALWQLRGRGDGSRPSRDRFLSSDCRT